MLCICLSYGIYPFGFKRETSYMLGEKISYFQNKGHILLLGDFNVQTANNLDYIELDSNDYVSLPYDYIPDFPLNRESQDTNLNKFYSVLQLCIACRLCIVNGRTWPDNLTGSFTYLSPRGSSVVDYTISSVEFMEYIKYFNVGNITTYSDHCLLSIDLALNSASQASLHKLYLQTLILIDNEISQDTETNLKAEVYSFTSQVTSFDLNNVYAEFS